MAPKKPPTMTLRVLKRIKLGDRLELRILRVPTGTSENLIRVGVNQLPGGEDMSGAVFPESYLPDLIEALQGVANG